MKYLNYLVLDDLLADHFKKMVDVTVDGERVIEGRLVLYKHRNYTYQLILSNGKGRRFSAFLPIPFIVNVMGRNVVELDYTLEALTGGDQKTINIIKRLKKPSKSVFYDRKATLALHDE